MELVRHHPDSASLCRYVREVSGETVLLSFSAGKDAVVSWLQLREQGFTWVEPFYLYLVPDLEFVEAGLAYYERVFGTPIRRLPHPSLARMLRNFVFQPPDRVETIDTARWAHYDFHDAEDHVRDAIQAPDAFVALGTRTADSPIRLANVRRYGSLTPKRRSFLPVFDWKLADVVAALRRHDVKLTVDYAMFGRSFDGIDWRFLAPLKDRFPRDYEKILEWFPLAELELFRRNLGGVR